MSLNLDVAKREEWRDIPGYEGIYQVSNRGRVKSLERTSWNGFLHCKIGGRILKNSLMRNGYYRVTLSKDSGQQQFYIHRLVAEAFIPNPKSLNVIDHIDANKLNNDVSNLRWVTQEENMRHAWEMGLIPDGSKNLIHGINCRPVIRSDGKVYESIASASRDLGYKSTTMVLNVLKGISDTCRGYSFAYVSETSS